MTTETVVIRPAGTGDLPACAAIQNDWIDETPWMRRVHPREDLLRHLREDVFPDAAVVVAEADGRIAGYSVLEPDDQISALYVAPAARGRRVGARLLDGWKAERPDGLTLWTFAANHGARRFYAREGFAEIRATEGDNEEGLPDVLLAWPGRGA